MKNNWIDVLDESLVKDFYNNQTSEEQQEGLNTTLSFGTAGIRGKFGLGKGRLNKFTVSKVALGFAHYLTSSIAHPVVVIHYDTQDTYHLNLLKLSLIF